MRDLIVGRLATMAERLLRHTTPLQRSAYIEALGAQVRIMEVIAAERAVKPKSCVRPLLSDDYIAMLVLLREGDCRAAADRANAALAALADGDGAGARGR